MINSRNTYIVKYKDKVVEKFRVKMAATEFLAKKEIVFNGIVIDSKDCVIEKIRI